MNRWLNYWRSVASRITWDRSLLRGVRVIPALMRAMRKGRPEQRATIAFYPHPAGPWYTVRLALAGTSIRVTQDIPSADAVMIFDDRTISDVIPPETTAKLFNANALDISKAHVGRVFESVFGYPLSLDPRMHRGVMVQKSDVNGVHDGIIVEGPLSDINPDYIYQHLADSTVRPGVTEDLRCVCVGGDIIQVFRKEKATKNRFKTIYLETTLKDPETVFTVEERALISQFCQEIGLDFGSMDVLRDYSNDGKLYIVDVNKTCMPVLSMPMDALEIGLRKVGLAMERLILDNL